MRYFIDTINYSFFICRNRKEIDILFDKYEFPNRLKEIYESSINGKW